MISEIRKDEIQVNRRQFLAAMGAAGASLLAFHTTPSASAAVARPAIATTSEAISLASLKRATGSVFAVKKAEGTVHATLDRVVEDSINSNIHQYTARFTLTGNAADQLANEVYELRHPELGEFSLLLSPSGSGRSMTAVFCQIVGRC